jgi:hypothetical protein
MAITGSIGSMSRHLYHRPPARPSGPAYAEWRNNLQRRCRDPTRCEIDAALSKVLKLPDLTPVRQLFAREPGMNAKDINPRSAVAADEEDDEWLGVPVRKCAVGLFKGDAFAATRACLWIHPPALPAHRSFRRFPFRRITKITAGWRDARHVLARYCGDY